MDDLSLEDLQRQFLEVQEQDSTTRLADRNVIELVAYLIKTGKLKQLLFTQDGKEYITEKQLTREIRDQIFISGGLVFFLQHYSSLIKGASTRSI